MDWMEKKRVSDRGDRCHDLRWFVRGGNGADFLAVDFGDVSVAHPGPGNERRDGRQLGR